MHLMNSLPTPKMFRGLTSELGDSIVYIHALESDVVDYITTTECYCRDGSRASVGAAALAALPRVFLQRVAL